MIKRSTISAFRLGVLASCIALTTACNDTGFALSKSLALTDSGNVPSSSPSSSPSNQPTDPQKVICDPLDPKNQTDLSLGIKSSLYYIENFVVGGPYPVSSCAEFLTKGKKVDAELYLGDMNVTPRNFDAGFSSVAGNLIKKADGSPLVEWFMLQGESKIQLGQNQAEGYYQLATISDDGILLQLGDSNGQWTTVIDHQAPHSATMNCAVNSISLAHGQSIPMHFSYYQGPRVRVAMMLLWRKVSASVDTKDVECDQSRNDDYFFNGNTVPSTPLSPYQGLLARGWSPLGPENFLLASGVNKCVGANP